MDRVRVRVVGNVMRLGTAYDVVVESMLRIHVLSIAAEQLKNEPKYVHGPNDPYTPFVPACVNKALWMIGYGGTVSCL
ncbi:hypothetical protein KSP40_PGU010201 [Platanthera guangdongensis]|uniref:Uncharacterized protein n=1 Tax=Platanthera guangdongensis TaxID=2320717 RepID=A0ABR2MQW3_9ASPA